MTQRSGARKASPFPGGTILGYPRIGKNRGLKKALESFWKGKTTVEDLEAKGKELRLATLTNLASLGLDPENSAIPSGFSFYDHVLDMAVTVGAIPERFSDVVDSDGRIGLDGYSTIARGVGDLAPLEMTKWFDSNYHYLVPEIAPDDGFSLTSTRCVEEFVEAKKAGFLTRPVIVGPVTFLQLAKSVVEAPPAFRPLERLDDLLPVYVELLADFTKAGAEWIQIDEPALVADWDTPREQVLEAVQRAYHVLGAVEERPAIFVAAPYGSVEDALPVLAKSPVEAIGLDLVKGTIPEGVDLSGKTVVAGVVDGHQVWRTDLEAALAKADACLPFSGSVSVSSSTSLFHVPLSLEREDHLGDLLPWLAFADEKVREIVMLARARAEGPEVIADELAENRAALEARANYPGTSVASVREAVAGIKPSDYERGDFSARSEMQAARLNLPELATTTIGSFPQTEKIRLARAAWKKGELGDEAYEAAMKAEIASVIMLQEEIGLDVLVHGEAERNDMVQYFAEHLDGFAVTKHGWVQSYGSRCTRPSILWGDVSRPDPITVKWSSYAQSLTDKPVKGMLTGPVTILAWSFVRDDQPLGETAKQVALALRDEVRDLEEAGIAIIQIDEPALRELLPLRKRDQATYLEWSVGAFRLVAAGAKDDTQIHTHLCYSEFGEIIDAIDHLDADVTSIEAARSRMEVLPAIKEHGFERGIGPGVWDIHSPRVPSTQEIAGLLMEACASIPGPLLWVNPDCGLKTRAYPETLATLKNVISATKVVRMR